MNTFLKNSMVFLVACMSLEMCAAAPVCDERAIASYKQEIIQSERANKAVRTAVYLCAASAIGYVGYKFFHPSLSGTVTPDYIAGLQERLAALEKKVGVKVVEAKLPHISWEKASWLWFKYFCVSVRDLALQSAAVGGLTTAWDMLKQQVFYGKNLHDYVKRSAELGRVAADIEGYANMLNDAQYAAAQAPQVKEVLKQRCVDLCVVIEHTVAYMRYLKEGVKGEAQIALGVSERYLIERTNHALALLWAAAEKENPETISRETLLTLQLFHVDFEEACKRFHSAYCVAVTR